MAAPRDWERSGAKQDFAAGAEWSCERTGAVRERSSILMLHGSEGAE